MSSQHSIASHPISRSHGSLHHCGHPGDHQFLDLLIDLLKTCGKDARKWGPLIYWGKLMEHEVPKPWMMGSWFIGGPVFQNNSKKKWDIVRCLDDSTWDQVETIQQLKPPRLWDPAAASPSDHAPMDFSMIRFTCCSSSLQLTEPVVKWAPALTISVSNINKKNENKSSTTNQLQ